MKRNLKMKVVASRLPWVTFSLGGLALLIQWWSCSLFDFFVWRRDWLETGEFWRLLSGHFVHVSGDHLVWDLGVFLLVGGYLELRCRRSFLVMITLAVVLTDVFLRVAGRFDVYCGLSGLDFGVFASVCLQLCRRGRGEADRVLLVVGVLGLLVCFGKVGFEMSSGQSVFIGNLGNGFSVTAEAHFAGLVGALIWAGAVYWARNSKLGLTTYQLVGLRFCHVATTPARKDTSMHSAGSV